MQRIWNCLIERVLRRALPCSAWRAGGLPVPSGHHARLLQRPLIGLEEATRWGLIILVFLGLPLLVSRPMSRSALPSSSTLLPLPVRLRAGAGHPAGRAACRARSSPALGRAHRSCATAAPARRPWTFRSGCSPCPMLVGLGVGDDRLPVDRAAPDGRRRSTAAHRPFERADETSVCWSSSRSSCCSCSAFRSSSRSCSRRSSISASEGIPMATVAQRVLYALDCFPLVAVPVFIFVGNLMNAAGITEQAVPFRRRAGRPAARRARAGQHRRQPDLLGRVRRRARRCRRHSVASRSRR